VEDVKEKEEERGFWVRGAYLPAGMFLRPEKSTGTIFFFCV